MNLDLVMQEFNNQNRDDLEIIKAVLPHCSHQTKVSFALHCALDIEPLMTDKRSINALRAVELFIKTGTKVSQDVIDAAYDATAYTANAAATEAAASAAAYTTSATCRTSATAATAYTANAAATAAYDATAYTANNGKYPNIYKDKMRSYLNKLKELVLAEIPANYVNDDAAWLLAVVI